MITINNLSKSFKQTEALKDVSLTIEDGDIFGIIGTSGAGKSTLVRCINYLEKPDSGEVIVDGKKLSTLSEKQLLSFRKEVAMIFQNFNLLMQETCLKNVMFPLELIKVKKSKAKEKALTLLDMVGLKDKAYSYPATLSGGQKQRVAIARALACDPKILLCDEATSALDPNTTNQILDLLAGINKKLKITMVIITHQMSVVEHICNTVAILDKGTIVEKGNVVDVFSHPLSSIARKLVFPESNQTINDGKKTIRIIFRGGATSKPLLASLAIEEHVACSILNASIRNINGNIYGSMLIGVKSQEELDKAIKYLNKEDGVSAQEFIL